MNLKEFLKPYLRKLVWFFIIGVCGYIVFLITPMVCESIDIYAESGIGIAFISIFDTACTVSTIFAWIFFLPYMILELVNVQVEFVQLLEFPHIIVNIFYWYILTSLIYVVFRKMVKKFESLSKNKFIQSLIEPEG